MKEKDTRYLDMDKRSDKHSSDKQSEYPEIPSKIIDERLKESIKMLCQGINHCCYCHIYKGYKVPKHILCSNNNCQNIINNNNKT